MLIRSIGLAIGLTMAAATGGAQERADSFPTRPIKIVVPSPAGGLRCARPRSDKR
jgi:tripartite-type tricarboxylate transporter receptor subunit TctC